MNKRTILMMVAPATGHLNATYAFGKHLLKEGYQVIYASPSRSETEVIIKQGFETIICPVLLFPRSVSYAKSRIESLHQVVETLLRQTKFHYVEAYARLMNEIIKDLSPDLILLDKFLIYNYLLFEDPKPKTLFIETMLSANYRKGIPSLNSRLFPASGGALFQNLKIELSWQKAYLSKRWKRLSAIMYNPHKLTLKILKKKKQEKIVHELNFNRSFFPMIRGGIELVMPPKSLDLTEISPVSQIYTGSSFMSEYRIEHYPDEKLQKTMVDLRTSHQEKVWIYCSLGTVNMNLNKKSGSIFRKVIDAFKKKRNWELIISTGQDFPDNYFNNCPNIHIFQKVPQIEILQYCKAMITHGGTNTILECIKYLKPMLAIPLSNDWDHNGNSMRVRFYGLGIMDRFSKVSSDSIIADLKELMTNPVYLKNLEAMRKKIQSETGMSKASILIKAELNAVT